MGLIALPPPARSNGSCSFPASRFPMWGEQWSETSYYGFGVFVVNGWIVQNPSFAGYAATMAYLPSHKLAVAVAPATRRFERCLPSRRRGTARPIAEAELDVDYGGSPIVMGDEHDALAPGQRLPDTIEVYLASGGACMLHELTNRAGHTALLIGGLSVQGERLARLDSSIRAPERRVRRRSDRHARDPVRRSESGRPACASRSRPVGHRRDHASCHPARRTRRPPGRPRPHRGSAFTAQQRR